MPSQSVFRWRDGKGWLVLSGEADAEGAIRSAVLSKAKSEGGVAYIWVGSSGGEDRVVDDMENLGAPTGYFVDVVQDDDNTIRRLIADSSVVFVGGDAAVRDIRSALVGAAIEGIASAHDLGAVILVEGAAAAIFGQWVVGAEVGVSWLQNALVLPGVEGSVTESTPAQALLKARGTAIAVGIADESALALGPNGEVETWGNQQITVALGSAYTGKQNEQTEQKG